jgi:8-amino-7-oxononanoate synthase
MPYSYERDLAGLAERGRLRELAPRAGVDFTSNDYLALAESSELRQAAIDALARGVPVGAGGSRLLRGNHPEHEVLEAEAAAFFRAETALYFGGGFMANFSIFATLPQRGDLVVYDALIHASAHQGIRAGRAEQVEAAHNDAGAFEDAIRRWRAAGGTGRPWIAVESLYSMDGDRAPLADLIALAERHDGMLVVDEAHATGVFGPDGRGLGAAYEGRSDVISLHTCGKALGSMGGLICAPRVIRDFLVNRCRPFIYATAPSPLIAATVRAALELCRKQPERREQLATLTARAGHELRERCGIDPSGSQIQPVIVGSDPRAAALAAAMRTHGYDIRAIRPPTVPEGTARLRIALTLNASQDVVSDMLGALSQELRKLPP